MATKQEHQGPFRPGKTKGNRMKKPGESYMSYRGQREVKVKDSRGYNHGK